jgi:hypothetical protein
MKASWVMGDGGKFSIKVILMLTVDVCLEVVAGNRKESLEKNADGVVNGCTPGNQLVIFVKLVMHLVDVAADSCRVYS